jgi:hypothetical protein
MRKPSKDAVPSLARPYWEGCSTIIALPGQSAHVPFPAWFTNKMYNYHTGQTWWQFFVKAVGLQEAIRQRQAFLDGHRDVRGNYWCGGCYQHMLLINLGERLGFPDAHTLYALKETRQMIGYEAWLHLAREGGDVLVGMLVDGIRSKYPQVMRQEMREETPVGTGTTKGDTRCKTLPGL